MTSAIEIADDVADASAFIHKLAGEQLGKLEKFGHMPTRIEAYASTFAGCIEFAFTFDELRTSFTMFVGRGKRLDNDAVAFRIQRNMRKIKNNLIIRSSRRNISLANAAVMRMLGIEEQVREYAERPRAHLWIKAGGRRDMDTCSFDLKPETFTHEGRDIKLIFDNTWKPGHYKVMIETAHLGAGRNQIWGNGCLLVRNEHLLPQTLMMAAAGRPLDEVVSGTAFQGLGFTLLRMYTQNGRIGLRLPIENVPLASVLPPKRDMAA